MKIGRFHNVSMYKNNKTGIPNLHLDPRDGFYYAQIQKDKKRYRKCFKEKQDAIDWIKEIKNNLL